MNILRTWNLLARFPCGNFIFNRYLGFIIPYSGSIGARVTELRPGFARVELKEHHQIRNHLNSIHAVALMNLAELSSGLSLATGLPNTARAILTNFSIEFIKKARGALVAQAMCELLNSPQQQEITIEAQIQNSEGICVARASAVWRVGPKK